MSIKTLFFLSFLVSIVVANIRLATLTKENGSEDLPDSDKTPGVSLQGVTSEDVCTPGWAKKHRHVPEELKKRVYALYDIPTHQPGEYEIDHLISLELGGDNDIKNLWPQSYLTQPWNAHVKDKLENTLHKLVCNGTLELEEAQTQIAKNWIKLYKKYF
ncbi:env [Acrasis kona]|uniref:Env n=1 Tax=Acrasis kona TaxID=1008807 RepID=A0AAW2Z5K9_9EUKA